MRRRGRRGEGDSWSPVGEVSLAAGDGAGPPGHGLVPCLPLSPARSSRVPPRLAASRPSLFSFPPRPSGGRSRRMCVRSVVAGVEAGGRVRGGPCAPPPPPPGAWPGLRRPSSLPGGGGGGGGSPEPSSARDSRAARPVRARVFARSRPGDACPGGRPAGRRGVVRRRPSLPRGASAPARAAPAGRPAAPAVVVVGGGGGRVPRALLLRPSLPASLALSRGPLPPSLRDATSDQTWRPAEFKHISQRRKRN